jgi:hypothetical protein
MDDHLACYEITDAPVNELHVITDEYQTNIIGVGAPVMLCLPSLKQLAATPTPTVEPTASPTPPPGLSDCLCAVTNINPNQVVLHNVAGGSSDVTRKMILITHAVDALGVSCDPGEASVPTDICLTMTDDDGDVLIGPSCKTIVCEGGGGSKNVKRNVFFAGPLNCADSAVPDGQSNGKILTVGTGSDDTAPFVTDTNIKCFE